MKTNTTLISVILLLAVALSACAPAVAAAPGSQPAVRTLTVYGTGEVSLAPDIAYVYIGVHTEQPSAAEAVSLNNAGTEKLIEALTGVGVAVKDISTTNFSIWQNTQYGPDGQPTGTTYVVDNTVYVTVRDLTKLGDLLDASVQAGANNINSIQFDAADKTDSLSKARVAAVENAKAQAQELAEAAGVTLGEIQSISYSDIIPGPFYDAKGLGGGGGGAASTVPINPGTLQISASVTLTYEIK